MPNNCGILQYYFARVSYYPMSNRFINRVSASASNLASTVGLFDNWYDVVLFKAGIKKRIELKPRQTGKTYRISSIEDYAAFWQSNKREEWQSLPTKDFRFLKVKDKQVVDIGANIGSTAYTSLSTAPSTCTLSSRIPSLTTSLSKT